MYIAELKNKIPPGLEKMKDVLTSDVFSFFKYAESIYCIIKMIILFVYKT
ncbi:MAG: hypothetical protein M1326_08570 [Cyanobacteria bacterium]|nr:hypothetical protein [Cyanobacteriota bacterium]